MRSAQKELKFCLEWKLLTCDETYSMQSSNFDSIGIKPSLFTDNVGEFSFCEDREKAKLDVFAAQLFFLPFGKVSTATNMLFLTLKPGWFTEFICIFQRFVGQVRQNLMSYSGKEEKTIKWDYLWYIKTLWHLCLST